MIAVVVVTFCAPEGMLARCLASLAASDGVDRIIVVDTGGQAIAGAHDVELVRVANHGYGAAANVGFEAARRAGADLIGLLNDDVVVRPDWIAPLVAEFVGSADGARVGAVQPMLLTAGGDRVNSLGVTVGDDGAGVDIGAGDVPPATPLSGSIEVFTGGAVLFDPEFLEATKGFDERYFLYYEDVDLGRRGAELGWSYRLATASVVEHLGGVTTGAEPGRTLLLQERNRIWAAFRFGDRRTIGRALWLSLRRLRRRPVSVHVRALGAGLAGGPVRLIERRRARRASGAHTRNGSTASGSMS